MFIFWKGKTMVDYRDDNAKYGNEETNRENGYGENKYGENGHNGCGSNCGCECCQCKRIFMMLVVLILVFIAGIMVGNCGRCRYADNYYYGPMFARRHNNMSKPKKFHRGMQEIAPTADNVAAKTARENSPVPNVRDIRTVRHTKTARCIRMDRPTRMGSLILEIRLIRTGKLADLS